MNTDQETTQNNLSPTPLPIPSASGNGNGAPSGQGLSPILPSSSAPSTPTSTPASSGNGAVLPIANNNPGDLKNPSTGTFQKYSSTREGTIALLNDLQTSMKAHPNWTLIDFAKSYAPNSDGNNSLKYAANLANYLDSQGVKINPNTDPISSLQPNIFYFANAVSNAEGYGNAINPNTIPKTNNQLPSSSNKQQTQQPGWLQSLIQGIAKPFAQTAVTGSKILTGIPALVGEGLESAGVVKNPQTKENIQKAVDYTKSGAPVNLGFLGKVSPLGVNEKTGQQLPTGKGIEQALGTGAQMAATIAPVGKTAEGASFLSKLLGFAKSGAQIGGVYGTGSGLTENATGNQSSNDQVKNVINKTLEGSAGGAIASPFLGSISEGLLSFLTDKPQLLTDTLNRDINKALGISGKKTVSDLTTRPQTAKSGLETIIEYAKGTPVKDANGVEKSFNPNNATLYETLQAWQTARDKLYQQYTNLAQKAGNEGSYFGPKDFSELSNKLDSIAKNATPAFRNKVASIKNDLTTNFGNWINRKVPLTDMQQYVEALNKDINPGSDKAASTVSLDVAQEIRKIMDQKIQDSTGEGYQILRNKYANLKSIETDLTNQVKRGIRGSGGWFNEYIGDFGGIDSLLGVLSKSPTEVIRGLSLQAMAKIIKRSRDPELALQHVFKALQGEKTGIIPGITKAANNVDKYISSPVSRIPDNTLSKILPSDLLPKAIGEIAPKSTPIIMGESNLND